MDSFVMITGATGGLGKAFAAECSSRGWNLYLTDLRQEPLEVLGVALHNTYGVEVRRCSCDLTTAEQRDRFLGDLQASGTRFTGLINVAGGDVEGLFSDQSSEELRTILRLNVEAAMEMTHGLLRLRDERSTFRIINVASLAAFFPMPYKATYAASKRFMLDLSLALREELRAENVTVTALCPAGMPTTAECIAAIEAQGLMGQLTTLNTGSVAAGALDAAARGKAVYVPGALNRLLYSLGRFVPPTVVSSFVARRWGAAHRQRDARSMASEQVQAPANA
jgi:uncharacterized protein